MSRKTGKIILKAEDLDGFLTETDKNRLEVMNGLYSKARDSFASLASAATDSDRRKQESILIDLYELMGKSMREICAAEASIQVYSFVTPAGNHGEASRLIAKLRDVRTQQQEFVYYTQRAFELLFNQAYGGARSKNHLIVKTPVTSPVQNFAVHKIPNVDAEINDTVMCVLLRGALLPSIIMSKEIQEYSSSGYVTPFALFRIKRDDTRREHDMEYVLDLAKSFFDPETLDGKDLIFADPMNATGGSMVTVVKYLLDSGVKPKSIRFFNVISALKGALRIVRALPGVTVNTLWMDPVLNESAYICPGLGDAGDRINGRDSDDAPRNILQLIADYGSNIANLYRSQIRMIERTVLE